jgi:hypothetical protein
MERLFHDRGGVLRLAAIMSKALLCVQATALSGFDLFFGVSFRWGHDGLLEAVRVCGGGSRSACTCHMPLASVRAASPLRHVLPGLPAFFCQLDAVYIRPSGFANSHTVFCTPHRPREDPP